MTKGLLRLDLAEKRSGQAKHERLRDHFVSELIAGRLKPGQALPSENRLMQELGVARMTIRQAMGALEEDGLIRRVQGKGTFVDDDVRRKLKRGQDVFALIVPCTRDGLYPSLLHGFETAASTIHHRTIICSSNNEVGCQANIILQLLDGNVGGVAINPTTEPTTPAFQIHQIQKQGIPVVLLHRGVEGVSAPLLSIPFKEVGRLAGKALVERGHRRVAFLCNDTRSPWPKPYEEGLNEGLRAGGCDAPAELVSLGESIEICEEPMWAALRQVFSKPNPPTAIFCSDDALAEMAYILLPRLGLRVPEDVSLVGEGGSWRAGAIIQRLTSVVIDEIATGSKTVSLLHEMRCGQRPIDDNEEFTLHLDLYKGETLGMAPLQKSKVS